MTKLLSKSNLSERSTFRTLLVVSLCASMAAFGCTTDRNLGNGDPVVTPGSRYSPTGGSSVGSESGALPPPMMSSFSNGQATIQPQIARMTADEAAAIMAQQQPRAFRILGPVAPGPSNRPYRSDLILAQQQRGEVRTSVNSTIYSGPTEVITSGAGEPVASNSAAPSFVDTAGAGSTGFTSTSTIAGSSVVAPTIPVSTATNVTNAAAPVIAPSGTAVTPTSNAVSAPSGFASVRTLSPTAAAVVNPPASISGSSALATVSSSRIGGAVISNRTATSTTSATTTSATTTSATSVDVASPVRVVSTNGRLTITNTGTTRQQ